ncbi:ABC transporter substrate-binding protein [Neotamlana laminarinivorans]|uniref:ABC transporter substrate-binding protein n=1 Tax=Neotamlana laminarinivorans TaxID=2883124 RepID=A0A9X1L1I6_9FLAO|nr:ABC transporter substrate-binding protein [Tamlana laminarinivorans]MCB4798763.1 ABC transporter substrate-binding protein [Tamlana laminarinivorans]
MRLYFLTLLSTFMLFSCKENSTKTNAQKAKLEQTKNVTYAKGFTIENHDTYKTLTVTSPWPNSNKTFTYYLVNKNETIPEALKNKTVIKTPINKLVVTSTTNVPALEFLGVEDKLVGFPNTNFISSKKTRTRIEQGLVKDLNSEVDINTELLLALQPDLVIGHSVNGNNKSLNQIERFNIPVVIDGAWTENHPLGRAEWIKFIAAFFNKDDEAKTIFEAIEADYLKVKQLAANTTKQPTVFSGSMFKDIWNVPGGQSFMAKFLEDANTNYIWKNNTSTGSLQLNLENVLEKAKTANLWIGAGLFNNKTEMESQYNGYTFFNAYKNNNIYSYTKQISETGGLIYFELGPLRPDLVLKDIIKIAHPEVLPNYELYFFKPLN